MTNDGAPDLAGLCSELAAELDDVATAADGDLMAYRRGGVTFARVAAATLEVRLPADIAEAALHTRDTVAGDERGWLRFTPVDDERHVLDRATAWFQTAWRHAADN